MSLPHALFLELPLLVDPPTWLELCRIRSPDLCVATHLPVAPVYSVPGFDHRTPVWDVVVVYGPPGILVLFVGEVSGDAFER